MVKVIQSRSNVEPCTDNHSAATGGVIIQGKEIVILNEYFSFKYDPQHEKTNNLGFQAGLAQTGLFSHRSRLEA